MKCDKCGKELEYVGKNNLVDSKDNTKVTATCDTYKCVNPECEFNRNNGFTLVGGTN